ncbi:MAG TPA: 30S ribosomal protein S9 [Candidatus Fimihabitans intestinipullorum]|uniref:Small ribosomal subunit protein uS9 n=1 Tax=Candidatus Fimihabitans intestinipullorum TaxID=2840820 RepID=A0A9D1L4H8_9BACT|nr:30S ribosomal protein S9 [Candidatus Fimihabitans intestinipullorum]
MANKKEYTGTGRRKSSVAQVKMVPGTGKITVNGRDVRDFFPYETNVMDLKQPLVATSTDETFDIEVKVNGGGFTGQTGAIRLGITRALLQYDEANEGNEGSFRSILKKAGFITRDSRSKERKKPGLKAARRAPQFSKR